MPERNDTKALENKFERYDMVICDEFGYVSCDKAGAEMLFNHLSLRTDKKTTVINNKSRIQQMGRDYCRQSTSYSNGRQANAQGDSTEHDGKIVQNERNTRYDK